MTEQLQAVTYDLKDDIALVGFNRPEKSNAINEEVRVHLLSAVMRANEEAKCGILYGRGKHFCAGRDLRAAAESWKEDVQGRNNYEAHIDPREFIGRGNIPFIAAMQGATLGGGLETACACHIRVADETAFFGLPEALRGIYLGGGGSVRIARIIGVPRMQDMMLTGRTLSAEDGERCGLVNYVVPVGQALDKAKELATKVVKNAPLSNYVIINGLPRIDDMSHNDGMFFEKMLSHYIRSPESIDRMTEFIDKTAPRMRKPD